MDNISRFGVFVPSFIAPGEGAERARDLIEFVQRAEDLGFDSVWVVDHLLPAGKMYAASFLEPLSTLAVCAGATERVRLGTSILVLPVRDPVILAKELSTLQFMSDNRFIFGAGLGWNPAEFRATGGDKSQRGRRADEILDITIPLLEGETVTYHGRYYDIEDVSIEPRAERRPLLWIGGGSQLAHERSPDLPRLAPAVERRILRADGWIPRPTCPPPLIASDWSQLSEALAASGRDLSAFTVAHHNYLHFVPTTDPAKAREEQHRAFLDMMSTARGEEYLEAVYLFGTPDEIVASLQARVDVGVRYFMLNSITPDIGQLDDWVREIIPGVKFPEEEVGAAG